MGEVLTSLNHLKFPDSTKIASRLKKLYVKAQIMVPQEFVGAVMDLAQRKRGGPFVTMDYIDENRVRHVIYQILN